MNVNECLQKLNERLEGGCLIAGCIAILTVLPEFSHVINVFESSLSSKNSYMNNDNVNKVFLLKGRLERTKRLERGRLVHEECRRT